MKKSLVTLSIATILSISNPSVADTSPAQSNWKISVGLATITLPSYLGDNSNRALVAPGLSVSYKDQFFVSTMGGVGYNLINQSGWRAGPIMKYHAGRRQDGDESFFVDNERSNDLQGLGDIDGTAELGGFVEFSNNFINTSFEIRQGIDGHKGAIGDVSVQYIGSQVLGGKPVFFGIGPQLSVGDSDYLGAFFGVNEQQANGSGLSAYEINSGLLSYGVHASIMIPVTNQVSVIGFGGMDILAEDVADSPLVAMRGSGEQGSAGVMLNVSF